MSKADKLEKAVSAYLSQKKGGVSDFGGGNLGLGVLSMAPRSAYWGSGLATLPRSAQGGGDCPNCPMCQRCGGAIDLTPRQKGGMSCGGVQATLPRSTRGGELAVPRPAHPSASFFGAGMSGGKMAKLAGMGVTGGGSSWIQHVKRVAAQEGITYGEALKVASKSYRRGGMMTGGAFMDTLSDPVGDRTLEGGNIFQKRWWDKRFNPGMVRAQDRAKQLEADLQKEREQRSTEEQMRRKIADERRYAKGVGGARVSGGARVTGGRYR